MKKIITIIGARPQFIKAAALSRLLLKEFANDFSEIIIHTGQHYDSNMSDVFFDELNIPKPTYNLNVGSGLHGEMTGQMLIRIEQVLIQEKPDIVLVYGDTNSTLAGALAASKLHIPLAHVEAGLRSFNKSMPEEQNRILTDHISDWLFCPTSVAFDNLKNEGLETKSFITGDIMLDAFLFYKDKVQDDIEKHLTNVKIANKIDDKVFQEPFNLLTLHRAENTDDINRLQSIFNYLKKEELQFIYPIHPRTKKVIESAQIILADNIQLISPVGYLDMISLLLNCNAVFTDSGGLQKEAYFSKKKCFTLRNETEWTETVESGWNTLVDLDNFELSNISLAIPIEQYPFYGTGNAAKKIFEYL